MTPETDSAIIYLVVMYAQVGFVVIFTSAQTSHPADGSIHYPTVKLETNKVWSTL